MYRACIAIADATRARVFAFERTADVSGVHEELIEQADLVNPARRRRPSELFSDSRPGSSRTGTRGFAFDDHRDAHVDKLDDEFAAATVTEIRRILREAKAHRLIVCASPRMLGALRVAELRHDGVAIDELPRDLVKLTISQLRDALASYGLLPPPPPRLARQA
ncbi:MAG: host attachment protein [Acidobacteriota bacterium]